LIAHSMVGFEKLLQVSQAKDYATAAVKFVASVSPRESDAFVRLVKGNIGASYIRENTLDAAFARRRA